MILPEIIPDGWSTMDEARRQLARGICRLSNLDIGHDRKSSLRMPSLSEKLLLALSEIEAVGGAQAFLRKTL
jgi:hypothetical protein